MGVGLITGQEDKSVYKVDSRLIQSAYSNGLLEDAHNINMTDSKAIINNPHLVDETTNNIPTDLVWGIREIFYGGPGKIIIKITGINRSGDACIYNGVCSRVGNSMNYSDWEPEKYVHPTSDGNKHVPANGSNNGGKYLKATSAPGEYNWGSLASNDITSALGYTPGREYVHPNTSGNKHIPSGGIIGQILSWASDGTAKWDNTPLSISKISTSVDGNTLTAIYTDGSKEVLSIVNDSKYVVSNYNSGGTLINTITTEIGPQGAILISRGQ